MSRIRLLRRVERTARILRWMLTASAVVRIVGSIVRYRFDYGTGKGRKR